MPRGRRGAGGHAQSLHIPVACDRPGGPFRRRREASRNPRAKHLNGGVAGYVDCPQIGDVSSCEEIAPDNLNLPTTEENCYGLTRIGDYADGDLLFYEAGVKAVWKDGAWVYRYDRDLKFEDGTRALCREGVTEDDVRAGMEAGVRSCADYFVLP